MCVIIKKTDIYTGRNMKLPTFVYVYVAKLHYIWYFLYLLGHKLLVRYIEDRV